MVPDTHQEESYITGMIRRQESCRALPRVLRLVQFGAKFEQISNSLLRRWELSIGMKNSPSVNGRHFSASARVFGICQSAALIPSRPLRKSHRGYSGRRKERWGGRRWRRVLKTSSGQGMAVVLMSSKELWLYTRWDDRHSIMKQGGALEAPSPSEELLAVGRGRVKLSKL